MDDKNFYIYYLDRSIKENYNIFIKSRRKFALLKFIINKQASYDLLNFEDLISNLFYFSKSDHANLQKEFFSMKLEKLEIFKYYDPVKTNRLLSIEHS